MSSDAYGFTWCPICKYWVPIEHFSTDYDPVDKKLYAICDDCLAESEKPGIEKESLPFERKPWNYDERDRSGPYIPYIPRAKNSVVKQRVITCLYCDSTNIRPLISTRTEMKYECLNCGEEFFDV